MRLNERQAGEIQRAIALADDADAATSVARGQMERLRLQMEAQSSDLKSSQLRLAQATAQLQTLQCEAGSKLQELQSQRDAMAKALRHSRSEADAAALEVQQSRARAEAVEASLSSLGEQVESYEAARQAVQLQQQALLQQQVDLNRRERAADDSCKSFAAARAESQSTVASLKLELSSCGEQLQRAQGQLQLMGGSQGVLQQLEDVHGRLKRRGEAIMTALRVRCAQTLPLSALTCVWKP